MEWVTGGATWGESFAGPGAGPLPWRSRRARSCPSLARLLTSLASGSLRGLRPCGSLRGLGPCGSLRAALRAACALLAAVLALGCAGDLVAVEGGFRHRQHGYSFGAPGGSWKRIDVDGALIAFRRPGPQTMSVQSRCDRPVADVAIMARQLVIGVKPRELLQAGPLAVLGRNAWTQTFDTLQGGVGVRVKTVTLVLDGCVLDWVLAAAGSSPFEEAELDFDAWWQSFRLAPEAGPAEEEG